MTGDSVRPGGMGGPAAVEGVAHSIAIASGKGGVGKSTVAVNLAVALSQMGATTGLLDADIYGPSIPMMTGVRRMPESNGRRVLPIVAHGLRMMSLGFLMPEGAPTVWRGPMVSGAIQQFLSDVEWGQLDYLLIDLPPGTGDAQLTLAQSIPLTGAVVVMTPQDVAWSIASKAVAMFHQLKVPVLGLIENMSGFVCPHCGTPSTIFRRGAARGAGGHPDLPLLGEIPLDPVICQTGDRGEPIPVTHPNSPVADAFRRIAGALTRRIIEEAHTGPVIRVGP